MMDHQLSETMLLQHLPLTLKHIPTLRRRLSSIPYHLESLWLFTLSDLKTIVGPCTAFAILQQLGVSSFGQELQSQTSAFSLIQILKVISWSWISLLPFNIDNQRQSIEEDTLNKPWRPLPAGRLTPQQATTMMLVLYPVAICFGIVTGAPFQTVLLVGLGIWYNDLKGANASWIVRNFINACGITCFLSGALSVMLQNSNSHGLSNSFQISNSAPTVSVLGKWLAIMFGIILSGIQTQDMYDQEGDKILDRKTMPLVFGDGVTRWTIAIPVLFWSVYCPFFWSLPIAGYIVPFMLGALIAWRTLSKKTVKDDKTTSKLWNLWLVIFFTLPAQHCWLI